MKEEEEESEDQKAHNQQLRTAMTATAAATTTTATTIDNTKKQPLEGCDMHPHVPFITTHMRTMVGYGQGWWRFAYMGTKHVGRFHTLAPVWKSVTQSGPMVDKRR